MNLRDTNHPIYFELAEDLYAPDGSDGWVLQGPFNEHGARLTEPGKFCRGQRLDMADQADPLTFRIAQPSGTPVEFNISAIGIPVVPARVVHLFEQLGVQDVQFLPTKIASHPGPWFILNVTRVVKCIDDARCRGVTYWKPEDGEPKKVGTYRAVYDMRIDPAKTEGARIFRTWGWRVAIVVSQDIKEALEREHVTGAKFIEV
ncbi:imm11 family protein [Archangium lansingense]|uniref:imm11 family protein n=1 Tax=Archangium lansingense TaxID=2995310 RepID=UPI003B7DEEFE